MSKNENGGDSVLDDNTLVDNPELEEGAGAVVDLDSGEVEVIDDTPEKDRGRKPLAEAVADPTDEELTDYSDKVKERISKLTHARHDERRAKEAALRQAQELERVARLLHEENRQLRSTVDTGTQVYVSATKTAAEVELREAQRKYKDAYDAGDSDAVAQAATDVSKALLKQQMVDNFRPAPLQPAQEVVQTRQSTVTAEPESSNIDEKTRAWQADNQWFGQPGNEEMTSFALGLHQKLVNSGVDPRTDAYFNAVNKRLREVFPDQFEDSGLRQSSTRDTPRRPGTVVAPAARTTGASTKRVQLTASQVAIAKRLGLTPQQYATEMVKMERANG